MAQSDFDTLIAKVQKSIGDSNAAVSRGDVLLKRVKERVRRAEEECAKAQKELDKEIGEIVEEMDVETVRFIGTLEQIDNEV